MNVINMLSALRASKIKGKSYALSTDFKYTGLKEYPRPMLQRRDYTNLNGEWNYRILGERHDVIQEGQIVVPFSPECDLSGVKKHTLLPEEILEYKRTIELDKIKRGKRLILHFGAVDQIAQVLVNGRRVIIHEGGYTSFSVDITDFVFEGINEIKVVVKDFTDKLGYARGKQELSPGGMWYHAQSGIWQTVWMECVPDAYVMDIRTLPDIDHDLVTMKLKVSKLKGKLNIVASDSDLISEYEIVSLKKNELTVKIGLKKYKLWSPEEPNLYYLNIEYGKDKFTTYFAMRLFDKQRDEKGIERLCINHKPVFLKGILDQGYYPESLMTPPSEAAMIYDLELIKSLGYNMVRKHCKVEPMRWYYHCDRLGLVVWQDIVNGGTKYNMNMICNIPTICRPFGNVKTKNKLFMEFTGRKSQKSKEIWFRECSEIVNQLVNVPSISAWVMFNEGWGQFDSEKCLKHLRSCDSTRLVDAGSGWFHEGCGDIFSEHVYFAELNVKNTKLPYAISEYGGYSMKIADHACKESVYGYKVFNSLELLQKEYDREQAVIEDLIPQGLCATVFTQLSDVEDEQNGIVTYDRKVQKIF